MKHAVKSLKLLTSQADACLIPTRKASDEAPPKSLSRRLRRPCHTYFLSCQDEQRALLTDDQGVSPEFRTWQPMSGASLLLCHGTFPGDSYPINCIPTIFVWQTGSLGFTPMLTGPNWTGKCARISACQRVQATSLRGHLHRDWACDK